jgi:hypothetical protein
MPLLYGNYRWLAMPRTSCIVFFIPSHQPQASMTSPQHRVRANTLGSQLTAAQPSQQQAQQLIEHKREVTKEKQKPGGENEEGKINK